MFYKPDENVLDRIASLARANKYNLTSRECPVQKGYRVASAGSDKEIIGQILAYEQAADSEPQVEGWEDEGSEFLAWYKSFHFWGEDWGIYFDVQRIANFVSKYSFGDDPALVRSILYHEHFHFLLEACCARIEQLRRSEYRGFRPSLNMRNGVYERFIEHKSLKADLYEVDEALANAYAITRSYEATAKLTGLTPVRLRQELAKIFDKAPRGYRDYMKVCRSGNSVASRGSSPQRTLSRKEFRKSFALYQLGLVDPSVIDFPYFGQEIKGEEIWGAELPKEAMMIARVPLYLLFPLAPLGSASYPRPSLKLMLGTIRGTVEVEESRAFQKSLSRLARKNGWVKPAWEIVKSKLGDGTFNAAHIQKWPQGGPEVFSVRVNSRSPAYRAHLQARGHGEPWLALEIGDHKSMGHG